MCSGQVGLNFLLGDSSWRLDFTNISVGKAQLHLFGILFGKLGLVARLPAKGLLTCQHCSALIKNAPGSSQVSVTFQSRVERRPKHDTSDGLTCWLQGMKSSVCPAAGILSPIILRGLSLATVTPPYLRTPSMSSLSPCHWPILTTWDSYQSERLN